MTKIAAVDIGSNSVLMCVGEHLAASDFRVIYDMARTTRLGSGLAKRGRLSAAGMHRTLEALRECRRKAQILGVALARAIGTAALREASNADEFLKKAKEALGFSIEVVSGEKEAELTFLGVAGAVRDPLLILDVGGASTEIVLARDAKIERVISMPIGAARLREMIPEEDVLRFFVRVIEVVPSDLSQIDAGSRSTILVGGTATTLAAVRLQLKKYEPEKIDGFSFMRSELAGLVDEIRAVPIERRADIPGLSRSRAAIITSGGLIICQILSELGVEKVSISTRGLRHGVLSELAQGRF